MNVLRLVARPLIALPFIVDGISAVRNPEDHARQFKKVAPYLERLGVPPILTSDAKMASRILRRFHGYRWYWFRAGEGSPFMRGNACFGGCSDCFDPESGVDRGV